MAVRGSRFTWYGNVCSLHVSQEFIEKEQSELLSDTEQACVVERELNPSREYGGGTGWWVSKGGVVAQYGLHVVPLVRLCTRAIFLPNE
eukprot:1578104-Amphidinium_carterae.1